MAAVAQLVRVPDCGSEGRRFESDPPPAIKSSIRNGAAFFMQNLEMFCLAALVIIFHVACL